MDDAPTPAGEDARRVDRQPSGPVSGQASGQASRQARWWRRFGWTLAGVWLAFLADPFQDALANPNHLLGGLAAVALVAFAVVYLRPWWPSQWAEPAVRGIVQRRPPRRRVRDLAVLVVLTLLTLPGAGLSGLSCAIFVCTYALFTVPFRWVGPPIAALLVVGAVVSLTVPAARDLQGIVEGGFFACVAVFGISRSILRTNELAAAHQDLARLAVAEERSRFARDLHDLLGHSLTVVTLKAELAGRLLEADNEAARHRAAAEVADIERLARDALADVRAALAGYREVSLGAELTGARQALAAAGISAQLPGAVDDVPADRRELFGWVVREGVTNVVRHSAAGRCWVEVGPQEVAVYDDGRGPGTGAGTGALGSGLRGLADRARDAGASLTVGRSSAGGFALRVRMAAVATSAGPLLEGASEPAHAAAVGWPRA